MHTTWYVLEDGAVVDPDDCAPDDKGALRHKSGVAVAMRGNAHSSRGVDVAAMRVAREVTAGDDREMRPATTGKGYRTRGGKGE